MDNILKQNHMYQLQFHVAVSSQKAVIYSTVNPIYLAILSVTI